MPDSFDLHRFIEAQAPVWPQVQRELQAGQKRSHWMWFVFPQLAGLGHSEMARRYAIASLAEARAYLDHPLLGARLREATELLNDIPQGSITRILGSPDDMKFHASMTLFATLPPSGPPFQAALARYFGGAPHAQTAAMLATQGSFRHIRIEC